MALRAFLYLDRPLVRDFLAQAEGGVVDESTERQKTSRKGGFGAGVGAGPASLRADKSKEVGLETETTIRQVAASEFDRLYTYLESDGLVVIEEAIDGSVVAGIRRKQFLEVDARIRPSGLHQLLQLFAMYGSLAPLMEQLSSEVHVDKEALAGIQAFVSLAGTDKSLPVIASVPGAANFNVGLELDPAHALVEAWDMEASVLLKVQRVVRGNDSYLVGDPLGGLLKLLPEIDRGKVFDSLKSPEAGRLGISGEIEIRAPGIIGTPIAIYR